MKKMSNHKNFLLKLTPEMNLALDEYLQINKMGGRKSGLIRLAILEFLAKNSK